MGTEQLRLRLPGQLRPASSRDLAALGLTFEQARERMWFVPGDVSRGGCAAFAAWLRTGHGLAAALGLALELPAVAWLGERVYGWVAARRHPFPGHGGILAGYEPEHRSGGRGAGRADGVPAFCSR